MKKALFFEAAVAFVKITQAKKANQHNQV